MAKFVLLLLFFGSKRTSQRQHHFWHLSHNLVSCVRGFGSNCSAWCCANLDSFNVNAVIFVVWDACLCKCSAVTNAAGAAVQLEELCNETWLLFFF